MSSGPHGPLPSPHSTAPAPGGQATPLASLIPSKLAYGWASPVKLTVVATMMMMIPMMIKTMLSSRARRPSLRAPSTSPCCTLLRDYRERVAETSGWLSLAALWGPLTQASRPHLVPAAACSPAAVPKMWKPAPPGELARTQGVQTSCGDP